MQRHKYIISLFFVSSWFLSLNVALANSGSYIAAQFAEKEVDIKNAYYYYVDLVSRGETKREIIQRSIIYSALSGNFEVGTAISRKINDLELVYPAASLILLAEAIKKKKTNAIFEVFQRHKKTLPDIFEKVAEFWLFIINEEKEKAFSSINSLTIENEAQLQIINYNQLLAYVYFNEYEQAKILYENTEFGNFLFDSESGLALIEFFQKHKEDKIVESLLSKARSASDNSYYILAFTETLSAENGMNSFKVTPYKQIAELFFRWSQSVQSQDINTLNQPFYLSLANHADPTSSFLKFKLANSLLDSENYELSKEIFESIPSDDLFFMDSIVENTYAIEQLKK